MKIERFVFDTNALVSALILPASISRRSLEKADAIGILLFSEHTLAELNEVLIRSKFDKYVSIEDRLEYIERLEARYEFVETSSEFNNSRDIKDNKFLNLAYDGRATCLITGDQDLLILNPFFAIPILSTADFFHKYPASI